MQANEIFEKLKAKYGDSIKELNETVPSESYILADSTNIFDICHYLRDAEGMEFDYLSLLTAMDEKDNLGVVYHLYSLKNKHRVVLKTLVPKEKPELASVETIWRSADWHEREAWDMMGVIFTGHHNLIRILCCYDWEGFPLRKDYVQPDEYHGMPVPY